MIILLILLIVMTYRQPRSRALGLHPKRPGAWSFKAFSSELIIFDICIYIHVYIYIYIYIERERETYCIYHIVVYENILIYVFSLMLQSLKLEAWSPPASWRPRSWAGPIIIIIIITTTTTTTTIFTIIYIITILTILTILTIVTSNPVEAAEAAKVAL